MLRSFFRCSPMKLKVSEICRMAEPTGKGAKGKKQDSEEDKNMKMFIKLWELRGPKKYIRDENQMKIDQEIAKEYTRQRFKMHIEWEKTISKKVRLRDMAISALPAELQVEGKTDDMEPFPAERIVFTETPPIPGFNEDLQSKKK